MAKRATCKNKVMAKRGTYKNITPVEWGKPFTKKDYARLRRVCDVVREELLGPIPCDYEIAGPNKTASAASWIPSCGWVVRINFYDGFFDNSLERQLYTIVHEHIHVMHQPTDQIVNLMEEQLPKKLKCNLWNRFYDNREIVVDRMAGVLTKLLLPKIADVL